MDKSLLAVRPSPRSGIEQRSFGINEEQMIVKACWDIAKCQRFGSGFSRASMGFFLEISLSLTIKPCKYGDSMANHLKDDNPVNDSAS